MSPRRTRRGRGPRPAAEPLESRRLLAVLTITGTNTGIFQDGDDVIELDVTSQDINVRLNGINRQYTAAFYTAIEIHGLSGNDEIIINSTGAQPVDVYPGLSADVVRVCPEGSDLDALSGRVYVHCDEPLELVTDELVIYDSADVGNDAYEITGDGTLRLRKPQPTAESEQVWWDEQYTDVTLLMNNGYNTLSVASSVELDEESATLEVRGNGGEDTFDFRGSVTNDNVVRLFGGAGDADVDTCLLTGATFTGNGSIVFDAQAGPGLLTVTDTAATDAYTFDAAGTRLTLQTGLRSGRISYSAAGPMNIGLTSTADKGSEFNVDGLPPQTRLVMNAGPGSDTITLGDGALSFGDFGDGVNLDFSGGNGLDTLVFDDAVNASSAIHRIQDSSYDHPALESVTYGGIEAGIVLAGSGEDTLAARGSPGFAQLTLNGNDGNDSFSVQPAPGTSIHCHGGAPTAGTGGDSIRPFAGGTATNGQFAPGAPGAGSYLYPGSMPITFAGMETWATPPAAPAPDLAAEDDTGRSPADNVTRLTALTFAVVGPAAGDQVFLFRGEAPVGQGAATAAGWSTDLTFPSGTATYSLAARVEDRTTGLRGPLGPATLVTVDTAVPAAPQAPDLAADDDTGVSSTDDITADAAPALAGPCEAGALVRVFSGPAAYGTDATTGGGTWGVSGGPLADGAYAFTATQEDLAGNVSAASAPLGVTVDTVAPAPPSAINLRAASDTGVSFADNITQDATPTFDVTSTDVYHRVNRDGVLVTGAYATGNAFSEGLPPLPDGTYHYVLRAVDRAGNVSASSATLSVTIDTTPPPAPGAPDLTAASDSGRFDSDNITNDATPTLLLSPRETYYRLLRDGIQVSPMYATEPARTESPLQDGTYRYTLRSVDAAGNVSEPSPQLVLVIDTVRPSVINVSFVTAEVQTLRYDLTETVVYSISVADLTLEAVGGAAVPGSEMLLYAGPGVVAYTFRFGAGALPAGPYRATLAAAGVADQAGNPLEADSVFEFSAVASVASRTLIYRGASPGDDAPAAGKRALLPGQVASFDNISSHHRGVNAFAVDLAGLPLSTVITPDDLQLDVGSDGSWQPAPAVPGIQLTPRGGASGADRLTITLPDGVARGCWLRVTLKPTPATGLAAPDVFYFGNLPGETGGGGTPRVDVIDLARTRMNVGRTTAAALAQSDFNRDGRVNALDVSIVRANQRRSLPLFTAPAGVAGVAGVAGRSPFGGPPVFIPSSRPVHVPPRRDVLDAPEPGVPT